MLIHLKAVNVKIFVKYILSSVCLNLGPFSKSSSDPCPNFNGGLIESSLQFA